MPFDTMPGDFDANEWGRLKSRHKTDPDGLAAQIVPASGLISLRPTAGKACL